jgi:hypothetical protein
MAGVSSIALGGTGWRSHPAVRRRRAQELAVAAVVVAVPMAVGLVVVAAVPKPNPFLAAGIMLGALGLFALAASARYEVTLTILALYLGLADGVVKLESANQLVSSLRDVMIGAICLGAIMRMIARREPVRLPPLSGWVIAFAGLTLMEAFNPNTHGVLKIVGGFRQQLEWLPFFFFGYMLMRSKDRFRKLFVLLGTIALINGVVSTIQTRLTPHQLEKWGPGYAALMNGTGGVSGRTYVDAAGESRVRPMALGSDMGFGGAVGVMAVCGTLALLAVGGLRRRSFLALLLFAGALVGIVTSLARTDILGGVMAVAAFVLLSASAGRRFTRPLAALLVVGALGLAIVPALTSSIGNSVFSRYASITPGKAATTSVKYREATFAQLPADLTTYPFGAGLSVAGAGANFGGGGGVIVDGEKASAESQYNYVALELGIPGLLMWCALCVSVIALAIRGLPRVRDVELRIYLAAMFATVIAFTVIGFVGPTMSSAPCGPFFWFAVGTAAYWFADTARRSHGAQAMPGSRRQLSSDAARQCQT